MFVKQIDKKTALELAAKGKKVLVMAPITTDPEKWIDYEPNTLGHMLEGCLFFRREPAMEVELAVPVEIEPAQPDPPQPERSVARRRHWTSGSWWRCIMPAGRQPRLRTS